jgi:hypothetical protein
MTSSEGTGAPENAEDSPQDQQDQGQGERTFTQADVDRMITERISRTKATPPADYAELKAKSKRLAEIEDKGRTDLERAQAAVAAAEARERESNARHGARLVRAQFDVLAARRNPDAKTSDILEYVDLSRLIDENGEPDLKALQAAVNRLVPEPLGGPPAVEGGVRKSPPAGQNMDQLLRQAAGRTG